MSHCAELLNPPYPAVSRVKLRNSLCNSARNYSDSEQPVKPMSLITALLLACASAWAATVHAVLSTPSSSPERMVPEHVILFVLKGIDQPALKTGPLLVLGLLVNQGRAAAQFDGFYLLDLVSNRTFSWPPAY